MRLAVPAADINIGEVVKMTEGSDVPAECFEPGSRHCVIYSRCRLKGILAEAVRSFYGALGKHTLEELVQAPEELLPLLFNPAGRPREAAKELASSKP